MSDTAKVTAAKPAKGGAIYRAPLGTTLPTDAKTSLAAAFKGLGFCSTDGLTNSNTISSEATKAWGGEVVMENQTEKTDRFKFKMIEGLNVEVLKSVFGDANVSGTLDTGIVIKANATPQQDACWIFDMILANGALKRIAVPKGKVVEVAEIKYADNEPVGYDVTISATADTDGQTHYEYIVAGSSK